MSRATAPAERPIAGPVALSVRRCSHHQVVIYWLVGIYWPRERSPRIAEGTSRASLALPVRSLGRPTTCMPKDSALRIRFGRLVPCIRVRRAPLARFAASRRSSSWRAFATVRSPRGIPTDRSDLDRGKPPRPGASNRRAAIRRAPSASRHPLRSPKDASPRAAAPVGRADQPGTSECWFAASGRGVGARE
jgi:hypothetical protein